MPNLLNKDQNKIKEKDEVCIAREALILTQQAERRQKLLADRMHLPRLRNTEDLLEETQQRLNLVETREEFLNLYTSRVENPDGREGISTA